MTEKAKVYFLGAGMISVPVLEAALKSPYLEIVGTGTQPDKPSGRNRKPSPSPLGAWCAGNSVSVEKISSVNSSDFLENLRKKAVDIVLVVSFGQILKQEILSLPAAGCVNVHASLLPKYRGASPIASAILNGDTETGVSFMKMDKGLDTGPVYCSFKMPLSGKENAESLEKTLGVLAAEHMGTVLYNIYKGRLSTAPQENSRASYSGKILKKDGLIDWARPADEIERKSRAYHPWPGVSFLLKTSSRESIVRISSCEVAEGLSGLPGEVIAADKKEWVIACGSGALRLLKVVPQGKNEMSGAEFIRGCPLEKGSALKQKL
ncbi:MAG: methionyl-tRNA formyltransferase [Lentisphaerae bacterium GWF2_45_14]|nr:MAG: methionyl-tRNA formyltransferase [Lentisphaerae bacterium GWF2_45_14]